MNLKNHSLKNVLLLLFVSLALGVGIARSERLPTEITQAQAIARIRAILNNNSGPCRITETQIISATRVRAGWRVTARIKILGAAENAIWIVSSATGATPQNQLTSEIENGCQ